MENLLLYLFQGIKSKNVRFGSLSSWGQIETTIIDGTLVISFKVIFFEGYPTVFGDCGGKGDENSS